MVGARIAQVVGMSEPTPLHILMRFSDQLTDGPGTIESHQEVIREYGSVWMAKAGKTLAAEHIATIKQQVGEGLATFLYLVRRVNSEYELHRGTIVTLSREPPKSIGSLVPAYYRTTSLRENAGFWVHLGSLERAPKGELEKLVLRNTGSPARTTLMYSMAGLFLVRRKQC